MMESIVPPATPLIAILFETAEPNEIAFDLLSSTMLGEASGRDDIGFRGLRSMPEFSAPTVDLHHSRSTS
jgi:hypothetical protein